MNISRVHDAEVLVSYRQENPADCVGDAQGQGCTPMATVWTESALLWCALVGWCWWVGPGKQEQWEDTKAILWKATKERTKLFCILSTGIIIVFSSNNEGLINKGLKQRISILVRRACYCCE